MEFQFFQVQFNHIVVHFFFLFKEITVIEKERNGHACMCLMSIKPKRFLGSFDNRRRDLYDTHMKPARRPARFGVGLDFFAR